MQIQYKASKIWKVMDSLNGRPIPDANIELYPGSPVILNKGGGFYAGVNLEWREYKGRVYHEKYEKKEFLCTVSNSNPSSIDILFLVPKEERRKAEGIKWSGVITKEKRACADCSFYFGVLQKRKDRRVLKEAEIGESFLKMEYGTTDTLDYQKIFIEGEEAVYSVLHYSFEKKGFFLSSALKQTILDGSLVSCLQEGQTNNRGEFEFYLGRQLFTNHNKTEIFLFVNGKKYSFLPNKRYMEIEE